MRKQNELCSQTAAGRDSKDSENNELRKQFQQYIRETVLDEIQETNHEDEPEDDDSHEEQSLLIQS